MTARPERLTRVALLAAVLAVACEPALPIGEALRDAPPAADRLDRLPEGPAGETIRRAIAAHGGWGAWEALRAVDYRKTTLSWDERGSRTDSVVERHRYELRPGRKIRIDRTEPDGTAVVLANDGTRAWRFVAGAEDPSPEAEAAAAAPTDGSHYVFSQPFKLTDPGARFTWLGRQTLPDGTEVDAVRVRYDPGVGRSGGAHTWVYYFDAATHLLAGYGFGQGEREDEASFTRHGDYREVGGVMLYGSRTAWRVEGDTIRRVRVYRHEDHRVVDAHPDSIFRPTTGG